MRLVCTIYKCRNCPGNPCCAQCDATECVDRCKNHPDRCKVWTRARGLQSSAKPRGPRKPPVDPAEAVRLYHEGFTLVEIGEKLGITDTHVGKLLRKSGICRGRGGPTYDRKEIARMWKSGMTVRQIARAMGASDGTISSALKKMRELSEI